MSMVLSVEFIEITQSGTETFSSVELTKGQNYENCVPFMTLHGAGDYHDNHLMDVSFSGTVGSGIINFERDETRSADIYIKCFVVEFDPTEVKVQQGTFDSLTADAVTAFDTPESFTQTKTAMVHYWKSDSSNPSWYYHLVRGRVLSNGTQVDMYRRGSGNISGHYYLFEDISSGNSNFVVYHETIDMAAQAEYINIPAGRRDPTKSIIMGSYTTNQTGAYSDRETCRFRFYLKSVFRCYRATNFGTLYTQSQVLTFTDDSKVYVVDQFHKDFGTSDTVITHNWSQPAASGTATIISTSPMGIAGGSTTNQAEMDSAYTSMKFTSASGIQLERNSTGGSQVSRPAWSVIDWAGISYDTGSNSSPLDPTLTPVKSVENIRLTTDEYYTWTTLSKGQDVSNCVLFVSTRGDSTGTNDIRGGKAAVWLREPGLLVSHRNINNGNNIADVSVVEFYPDQVKVQSGEFFIDDGASTEEVTISGISATENAFVLANSECDSSVYWPRVLARTSFATTSGVEFYRVSTNSRIDGVFFVAEDLADNFRVTHYVDETELGDATVDLYPLDETHYGYYSTLPIFSNTGNQDNAYVDRVGCRVYQLGNGGRLMANRYTAFGNIYSSFQWVRFLDERIHTQPYRPDLDGSTTLLTTDVRSEFSGHEDALTAYNPNQNGMGRHAGTGNEDLLAVFHNYRLINNNTEIEISREATGGQALYPSDGGVIDWIGYTHPNADEDNNPPAYATETQSLVRSIEHFTYTGSDRWPIHYMTKGQRPENCVPFASWRVAADDGRQRRIMRQYYIDIQNHKICSVSNDDPSGGDIDESIYLVEFDPAQVRVQQIFHPFVGTSTDVDIPQEVDLDKTLLWFNYSIDTGSTGWPRALVTGSFLSSTQLNFSRTTDDQGIYLTIYLIECLQDQWVVKRADQAPGAVATFYDYINFEDSGNKIRFIQGSFSSNQDNVYVDRNCLRLYPEADANFTWNRATNAGSILDSHIEVLEFNPKLDIRVGGNRTDFTGSNEDETKDLGSEYPLDLDRSIVCPSIVNSINRANGTAVDDVGSVCVKFELTSSGTEIDYSRYYKGITTDGYFQWIEWPPFKTHYFEGTVTERGLPVIRNVACHRADTYELMDYTTSASGTGYYRLETSYSGVHYIVCQDDEAPLDYNDLVLGKMEPTEII